MEDVKPGKKTSEWKAVLATVLTALVAVGGALLSTDVLGDGTIAAVVVAGLISVAGVVIKYIGGRSDVKKAAALARAASDLS